MKLKNLLALLFLIVISICLAADTDAQTKRKSVPKKSTATKLPLVAAQHDFLNKLLELSEEADFAYQVTHSGHEMSSLAAADLKYRKKSYGDLVGQMEQVGVPRCAERLPKHMDSQAKHLLDSYRRMSDYLYVVEEGLRHMSYLQYSERKRSILTLSGLTKRVTDLEALDTLRMITEFSKKKLKQMISIYPKYIPPYESGTLGCEP